MVGALKMNKSKLQQDKIAKEQQRLDAIKAQEQKAKNDALF